MELYDSECFLFVDGLADNLFPDVQTLSPDSNI